jgi:sulfur relay (sulfurtransferase) DsrC/TusE family protein
MKNLIKNNNSWNKPKIKFIADTGQLSITGKAIEIDYDDFLEPMLDWTKEYIKNPAAKTVLSVDLEYFNTVAMKSMVRLMALLSEKLGNDNFTVKWFYLDEDTYETLIDFEDTLDIKIEKIPK